MQMGRGMREKKVKAIMKTLQAFCAAKSSAEVLWHGTGVRDGEIFISKLSFISLILVFCFALLASSMGYYYFFFFLLMVGIADMRLRSKVCIAGVTL